MGTPISEPERMVLACNYRTVPIVPSEQRRLSHWPLLEPEALTVWSGLSFLHSERKGLTRWPPRPLEVLPNWNSKPHPKCPE